MNDTNLDQKMDNFNYLVLLYECVKNWSENYSNDNSRFATFYLKLKDINFDRAYFQEKIVDKSKNEKRMIYGF